MNYEKKQRLIALRDNMKSYGYIDGVEELESIFPELAESEDDRTKKDIINLIYWLKSNPSLCSQYYNDRYDNMLAYLEKQKVIAAIPDELVECYKNICERGNRWVALLINAINGTNEQKEQKPVVTHGETYRVDTLGTQQVIAGKMPQKLAEWSDTNELVFNDICKHLENEGYSGWVVLLNALRNGEFQFKQEWSEEDEDMLNCCISSIEEAKENRYAYKETDGDTSYDHEIAWLKSLRPVSKESLQPHWKPCEEQIHAIIEALKYLPNNKDEWMILNTLVDVFKKLM